MKYIFVGPSHIPRLKHAFEIIGLPKPSEEIVYIGDGGYPIWMKSSLEECMSCYEPGDKIIIISPDFRFGNSILESGEDIVSENFFDGFTHVKRGLINVESDILLRDLCLRAITEWKERFKDDVRILHWTLAFRTVRNRIENNYVDNKGKYKHPVWNVSGSEFKNELIGLDDVEQCSLDTLRFYNQLVLDRDLHPSTLGYLYISSLSKSWNHSEALESSKKSYMRAFNYLLSLLKNEVSTGATILGDSDFLAVLSNIVPQSIKNQLRCMGVDISNNQKNFSASKCIIFVSSFKLIEKGSIADHRMELEKRFPHAEKVKVLYWDQLASSIMGWRARKVARIPSSEEQINIFNSVCEVFLNEKNCSFLKFDSLVEYGAGGVPTVRMVFLFLACAFNLNSPEEVASLVMKKLSNRVDT